MTQLTFKSPGVSTREIDLSGPTAISPAGVPAGVIGTAVRGPAFVPITVATFKDFVSKFGTTDGEKFGPLAMREWLRNANAGTYVRLLGIGDGKKRTSDGTNAGRVNRAGFVVGGQQVQSNGFVGHNPYAVFSSNAEASATFTIDNAADVADNDQVLHNVPILVGGEGPGGNILFANGGGAASDNRIRIQINAASGATREDLAELVKLAINGTVPAGNSPSGQPYAGNEVIFANAGTIGASGVKGVSATRSGHVVTIVANKIGAVGSTIVFSDFGATNAVATCMTTGRLSGTKTKNGPAGRTYILGAFHKQADGTSLLTEAGIQTSTAHPLIRGVVMAPSGVALTLGTHTVTSTDNVWKSTPYAPGGSPFGDVVKDSGKQEFSMILNGHKASKVSSQIITASFDPTAPNYFRKVFNTDPTKIEEMGHYLYTSYDAYPGYLVVTASGITGHDDTDRSSLGNIQSYEAAFLLSGSAGRNSGNTTTATNIGVPNFEGFEDRFRTAHSPFVISQKFGGKNKNLFKVHALDDGRAGSDAFKITILNIQASTNQNNPYGTFDLIVRFFEDSDHDPVVLEKFTGLDLNPSSENFIARRIGNIRTYYDFDKSIGSQRLVREGTYANVSNYIRVELSSDLEGDSLNDTAIPVGFRGLNHLVTSGSAAGSKDSILTGSVISGRKGTYAFANGPQADDLRGVTQLPVPFRPSIHVGVGPKREVKTSLCWGVQFEVNHKPQLPNKDQKLDESIRSFVRYFGDYHTSIQPLSVGGNEGTPDVGSCVLDADRFNNNLFSLERVQVLTASGDRPDSEQWAVAAYRRNGTLRSMSDLDGNASDKTRFLNPATDFSHLPSRKYLKFTFPLQGGFDGVDIFDKDRANFNDASLRREMDDSSKQGGTSGPTVAAYRKAIGVMEEKADVDIQLLAIPGVRHESITDFAIESVERRFDALYIMDVEERDTLNAPVTGSGADVKINVRNTVDRHASRNFDTSFAAAYFPDVVITDPATDTNVRVPPSVPVLGAMAFNDSVAHPWFAPAGFNRGALTTVVEEQVKLNRDNLDSLYDVDINPICSFPSTPGVVVWGQKTLLAGQSALDRVNVRRLLIDIRRQVKLVGNVLLFEPNKESTLSKFSNAVTPILSRIQQQQGLDRFRVQIDTTTTTQADVENNTIRGKIFVQPTRSVEFISLDFVVTNAGEPT